MPDISSYSVKDDHFWQSHTKGPSVSECVQIIAHEAMSHDEKNSLCQWLQYLVTRGVNLEGVAPLADFWRGLDREQIPLARLPLRLLANEARIVHIRAYESVDKDCQAANEVGGARVRFKRRPVRRRRDSDIEMVSEFEALGSAFDSWTKKSNGRMWSRVFRLAEDPGPLSADLLARLGPNTWTGWHKIGCKVRTLADVTDNLFQWLGFGGAYGGGKTRAGARLAMWSTLAELTDAPRDAEIPAIEAIATKASFAYFDYHAIFYEIAWDIGLACFNRKSNQLRLLAVTDTD